MTPEDRQAQAEHLASISAAERFRQERAARNRQRRQEREAKILAGGICPKCQWRPLADRKDGRGKGKLCRECQDKANAYTYASRRRAQETGICPECRKRPARPGMVSCEECAEAARLRQNPGTERQRWPMIDRRKIADNPQDRLADEDRALAWQAMGGAVNALVVLTNSRPEDKELRRLVRSLLTSARLLMPGQGGE